MIPTIIRKDNISGIQMQFEDFTSSGTVSFVFNELKDDYYGLEQINLSEKDIVIDIGANVGMFSIYVKKKFNCKVISFEPIPINFEHFKRNIILNGLSLTDFELHNSAITKKEGDSIRIGISEHNSGGASIFDENINGFYCPTETLDKYISKNCKYLKIDCEGGEYEIIPSILENINIFKYIGIEYHKYNNEQNPHNLHKLLTEYFKGKIFYKEFET